MGQRGAPAGGPLRLQLPMGVPDSSESSIHVACKMSIHIFACACLFTVTCSGETELHRHVDQHKEGGVDHTGTHYCSRAQSQWTLSDTSTWIWEQMSGFWRFSVVMAVLLRYLRTSPCEVEGRAQNLEPKNNAGRSNGRAVHPGSEHRDWRYGSR